MIQRIYASTFMLEKKMTRAGPTASCGYTQPYTHTKRAKLIFAAAARESIRHGGELHCVAKNARNPSTHQEAGNISGMVKSAQLKSVTSDSHKRADQFFFFFFFPFKSLLWISSASTGTYARARQSLGVKCSNQHCSQCKMRHGK